AADVIYGRLTNIPDPVSGILQPPAEIHFFHMRIEICIESAKLVVEVGPHHETPAGGPEYFYLIIVLSLVFFEIVENTAAAEEITPFIHKPAARACIFEILPITPVA